MDTTRNTNVKTIDKTKFRSAKQKYNYSQETVDVKWGEQENDIRKNWPSRAHYIMTALGFLIGTNNFSDFPNQCMKHGGLVYIGMYMALLVVLGMPLMLLELAVGQFTSQGPVTCWKMAPLFNGIGVGMLIISLSVSVYYNLFIAWNLELMISCFTDPLPWTTCNNDYNTPYCHNGQYMHSLSQTECIELNMTATSDGICYLNETQPGITTPQSTMYGFWDISLAENQTNLTTNLQAGVEYFNRKMFGLTDDGINFENIGPITWQTVILFICAWVVNYIANFGGLGTSGYISYFTASYPFIVGIIFAAYFATLDGAQEELAGLYTEADWKYLYDVDAWNAASVAVLVTLSISWGGFIMLASYNPFHNNIVKDMLIFTMADLFMNIVTTVIVFSLHGYLKTLDIPNMDIYLDSAVAIGHLSSANVIAFAYSLFLLCISIDTQFVTVETVFTSICDLFPSLHSKRRLFVTLSTVVFVCIGVPLCTQGGRYVYLFLEKYCAADNLILLSLLEVICIGWVYGTNNLGQDIGIMMGNQKVFGLLWPRWSKWFAFCWKFLTPGCLFFVAVSTALKSTALEYFGYEYPGWSLALGVTISLLALVGFITTTIKVLLSKKSGASLKASIKKLVQPDKFWGPSLVRHRVKVGHLKNFDIDPFALGSDQPILHGGTFDISPSRGT